MGHAGFISSSVLDPKSKPQERLKSLKKSESPLRPFEVNRPATADPPVPAGEAYEKLRISVRIESPKPYPNTMASIILAADLGLYCSKA